MIDLREELQVLYKETFDMFVLRHLGNIRCKCIRNNNTADPECPDCEGHGWIFEEFLIKGKIFPSGFNIHNYDADPGIINSDTNVIYIAVDTLLPEQLRSNDRIFKIRAHKNGDVITKIERMSRWVITQVDEFHEQHNKIEFYKVYIKPEIQ